MLHCIPIVFKYFTGFMAVFLASSFASAQWSQEEDAAYAKRFHERFPQVSQPLAMKDYATPARYDELFMGEKLESALQELSNDTGSIAWGWSYRMMSLNEMFHATGDERYLQANVKAIQKILAARDDAKGIKLWTGKIAPAWGSDKYAERGRAIFAVHTGMITYPMFDCLLLAGKEKIGNEFDVILNMAQESLAFHDPQWRDGPGEGEGHYVGLDQENVMEGKPLPGNRLSAMGRALLFSWKVSGNRQYYERALALGRYIKNRLTLAADGAYYWPYWLPLEPVTQPEAKESINGEDISHGSLTMSLPILLASDKQVFSHEDMLRLGDTVTKGFARLDNGILFGDVTGNPKSNPALAQLPARWLLLTPFVQDVSPRISTFYLHYQPTPGPLDLALLLRYAVK
ncbi:MAG: hypothetical protein C4527_20880 [Candidatus Omnitrophota bacterium]|nr:MAG: hypothetical protein C4527_20880 [Candidatus Omnitrophota bacterium]